MLIRVHEISLEQYNKLTTIGFIVVITGRK